LERPAESAPSRGWGGQPLEGEYQQQLYELMRVIGATGDRVDDWRRHRPNPSAIRSGAIDLHSAALDDETASAPKERVWVSRSTDRGARTARQLVTPGALQDAEFSYQPAWFAGKGAVTLYACELWFRGEEGRASIDDIMAANPDPLIASLTDLLVVRKGLSDIARCCGENRKALVRIPVHYATIANREMRDKLVAICESVPNLVRRLLILEITDLRGIDWGQLAHFVTPLNRVCRSVSVRLGIDGHIPRELAATGVSLVGGDMRDYRGSEAEAIEQLRIFACEAKRAGLASYVLGLETRSLVLGAIFGGFDYASGAAVAASVASPVGVHSFELIDLYRSGKVGGQAQNGTVAEMVPNARG
jgi:hypothetical protein